MSGGLVASALFNPFAVCAVRTISCLLVLTLALLWSWFEMTTNLWDTVHVCACLYVHARVSQLMMEGTEEFIGVSSIGLLG